MDELQDYNVNDLLTGSEDFLGKGTYANVRKCYFCKRKQFVAVKIFPLFGDHESISQNLKSIEKEAIILCQFEHKNIVRTLGITKWNNYIGIIMELISCGTLRNLLSMQNIDISWNLRSRFSLEIANALKYLHWGNDTRHYIHGDLKPQNILLDSRLTIKLADFGSVFIAQATGACTLSMTSHKNTQHTPFYTAPEYLNDFSKEKTTAMDVYSYGMNGYEIISRKQVFSGSAVHHQVIISTIKGSGTKPNIDFVEEVGEQCKPLDMEIFSEMRCVMLKCWETDPACRPQISEVWETLNRLAQSHNVYNEQTTEEAKKIAQRIIRNRNDTTIERIPLDQYNDSSFLDVEASLPEQSNISVKDSSENGEDKAGPSKSLAPTTAVKQKTTLVHFVIDDDHYFDEDQYRDDDRDNYLDDYQDQYEDHDRDNFLYDHQDQYEDRDNFLHDHQDQ